MERRGRRNTYKYNCKNLIDEPDKTPKVIKLCKRFPVYK